MSAERPRFQRYAASAANTAAEGSRPERQVLSLGFTAEAREELLKDINDVFEFKGGGIDAEDDRKAYPAVANLYDELVKARDSEWKSFSRLPHSQAPCPEVEIRTVYEADEIEANWT